MSATHERPVPEREEILAALSSHQAELKPFGIRSLALFGSTARNEAGPESDLDFLVEFDRPATFDGYMGLKMFLEDLLRVRVDLVMRKALKDSIIASIERDAVRVA